MLLPLIGPSGLPLPTTAAGVREHNLVPSPGGGFPLPEEGNPRTPMPGNLPPSPGGVTDIDYQPPKQSMQLGGSGVVLPFSNTTNIERTPAAQSTPKQARLN